MLNHIHFGLLDLLEDLSMTLDLAPAVEQLGYHRYWIAEHPPQPSPQLVAALVAGITDRLRVGTAGILFPYYSPAKAAYDFQLLEAVYAGRIDAGISSSKGNDNPELALDLLDGRPAVADPARYPQRVSRFIHYLRQRVTGDEAQVPESAWSGAHYTPPQIWVHGNGAGSAACAAQHGLSLSVSLAHPNSANLLTQVAQYRACFQASANQPQPRLALTVAGICAASSARAQHLTAESHLKDVVQNIVGTPDHWLAELTRLAALYQPDDIIILDLCNDYADHLASYTLLAEAVGLAKQTLSTVASH